MALNPKLSNIGANAAANAICALLNSGYIDIYDGTQPATADTAVTSQVKLARLTFGNPAFGSAVNGVSTANSITSDSTADNTGTATWFRACKSDGSAVFDGSVGTGTHNLVLSTVSITAGAVVGVSSCIYTESKG